MPQAEIRSATSAWRKACAAAFGTSCRGGGQQCRFVHGCWWQNEQRQQGQYPVVFSTDVILYCNIANVQRILDDLAMKSAELLGFRSSQAFRHEMTLGSKRQGFFLSAIISTQLNTRKVSPRPLNLALTNTNAMRQSTRNDGGGFHHVTYVDVLGNFHICLSCCLHAFIPNKSVVLVPVRTCPISGVSPS